MAVDAAEADLDEPGVKAQLKGLKQCFTDPKVYVLALAYVSTLRDLTHRAFCWSS